MNSSLYAANGVYNRIAQQKRTELNTAKKKMQKSNRERETEPHVAKRRREKKKLTKYSARNTQTPFTHTTPNKLMR